MSAVLSCLTVYLIVAVLKMDVSVRMLINRILLLCFRRTMIIMILLIPYIAVLVQCSIPQSEIIVQWGGYSSRKYLIEGANRPDNTESADFPLIRLAEVHCIYAEATCELNNGNISDEDLNFSINKNRARAGVAPLTNALIANVWDAGYWDHATGKTICKK